MSPKGVLAAGWGRGVQPGGNIPEEEAGREKEVQAMLGKSGSKDTSGSDWKPRDLCKKLGSEIRPFLNRGWDGSKPLPPKPWVKRGCPRGFFLALSQSLSFCPHRQQTHLPSLPSAPSLQSSNSGSCHYYYHRVGVFNPPPVFFVPPSPIIIVLPYWPTNLSLPTPKL